MARLQTLAGTKRSALHPHTLSLHSAFQEEGCFPLSFKGKVSTWGWTCLASLLAGTGPQKGRVLPAHGPATAPIRETPTLIRIHSIWGLVSPGPLPTAEVPPPLLALTRDFSASLAGSMASQMPCAELKTRSSRKPRAQRTCLPQLAILRLVAGFPSARVTSTGQAGERRQEGLKGRRDHSLGGA